MKKYIKTTKSLRKPVTLTTLKTIAFNGSQQLRYVMPRWKKMLFVVDQSSLGHQNILLTMKTITNTDENQKFIRAAREESVKTI